MNKYQEKKAAKAEINALKKQARELFNKNKAKFGLVQRLEFEVKIYKSTKRPNLLKLIDDIKKAAHVPIVKMVKKVKKNYGCNLIFYRLVAEDDDTKYDKTIKNNGHKYRQIYATTMANVIGDILPYNNKKTFCPIKEDMDDVEFNNAQIQWSALIKIIKTDDEIKDFFEGDLAEYIQTHSRENYLVKQLRKQFIIRIFLMI